MTHIQKGQANDLFITPDIDAVLATAAMRSVF